MSGVEFRMRVGISQKVYSMNNGTQSIEVASNSSNSPTVESGVLSRSNDIEMEFINIIFYHFLFYPFSFKKQNQKKL